MLVWIQATSAAIGVFAIFILLLGVTIAEDNQTTTFIPEDIMVTVERSEPEDVLFSDLPFAHSLANQCSSSSNPLPVGHRANFAMHFYSSVSHYSNIYREEAENIISESTIPGCHSQELPNLPNTPTLGELEAVDVEEALNKIYSSLLMHSAYAYFIHHQHNSNTKTCFRDAIERTKERNLAKGAETLAKQQRSLACLIKNGITALGYSLDGNSNAFLNERVTNLTDCSRRYLRDCQIMRSIVQMLDMISTYSRE